MHGNEDWELIHMTVDIYIIFTLHHSCLQVDSVNERWNIIQAILIDVCSECTLCITHLLQ